MTKWQKKQVVYWSILCESQKDTLCRANTQSYSPGLVALYDELYEIQIALREMNQ